MLSGVFEIQVAGPWVKKFMIEQVWGRAWKCAFPEVPAVTAAQQIAHRIIDIGREEGCFKIYYFSIPF